METVCGRLCGLLPQLSALPAERTAERTYRLPTEAEWEYACRAGTAAAGVWRRRSGLAAVAWFKTGLRGTTHPAGQKKPNAWGLYDMYGHVWQWCADWFGGDYYKQSPPNDPTGPLAECPRVLDAAVAGTLSLGLPFGVSRLLPTGLPFPRHRFSRAGTNHPPRENRPSCHHDAFIKVSCLSLREKWRCFRSAKGDRYFRV